MVSPTCESSWRSLSLGEGALGEPSVSRLRAAPLTHKRTPQWRPAGSHTRAVSHERHTRTVRSTSTCRTSDCTRVCSQCSSLSSTSPTTVPVGASLREVVQGTLGEPSVLRLRAAPLTQKGHHSEHQQAHTLTQVSHSVTLLLSDSP